MKKRATSIITCITKIHFLIFLTYSYLSRKNSYEISLNHRSDYPYPLFEIWKLDSDSDSDSVAAQLAFEHQIGMVPQNS